MTRDSTTASPAGSVFTRWLDGRAVELSGVCPDEPLDDLEPLGHAVRDARVVAIGENSHFIREFGQLRERVLRYLVERLGFTLLSYEYGFSEGVRVDAWVRGEGGPDELDAFAPSALPVGMAEPLRWLRARNLEGRPAGYVVDPDVPSSAALRFAGVDLPAAGGSLRPALDPVAEYLREIDPGSLPWLEDALRLSAPFSGESGATAANGWAALPAADQDALTACLARLRTRLLSIEPSCVDAGGGPAFDLALRRVEGACAADATFRATAQLFAGEGMTADTSIRERYMADSVLWHLRHGAPGTRIVLVAHNAHIQRTPIGYGGEVTALPMGLHLARTLGRGYYALGLTGVTGDTARMDLNAKARFGFTVAPTPLDAPSRGQRRTSLRGPAARRRGVRALPAVRRPACGRRRRAGGPLRERRCPDTDPDAGGLSGDRGARGLRRAGVRAGVLGGGRIRPLASDFLMA